MITPKPKKQTRADAQRWIFEAGIKLQVGFDMVSCPTCGIVYALPKAFLEVKREGEGRIHCPAGHRWKWVDSIGGLIEKYTEEPEPVADSREVRRLQRELVHALHRAEQAEAAASVTA